MKKLKKPSKKLLVLIVFVVVAGLLVAWHVANHGKNSDGTKANLSGNNRSNFLKLSDENVVLTNKAINAMLDESADAESQKTAAYNNAQELGGAIKALYSTDTETTFNKTWKVYMDQAFVYAAASKKGDEAAKTTALNTINTGYTVPLSQYLSKLNPAITEVTVRAGLAQHAAYMLQMAGEHAQGKLAQETADLQQDRALTKTVFGVIADGIKHGKASDPNKRTYKKL
ncbi:MAG: hypothetical protein JWL89_712 [Candidatus Saccharibacteria bacterium]|nr:hypothetical protein [Candidatus Saccharibacteria bacterium]